MPEAKRLLVLVVDVDNDLGEKTKVRGPVVGRERNVVAATKLAIADPEDSDANTMFAAVKIYDELRKEEKKVEIATVTGDSRLGYKADRKVIEQLEKVIGDFAPEACVFLSDGASDDQVIPVIQSRIKINSVRTITVKQTKELEKTYFVVLEKLKDPAVARIVFGIPGIAFLLYFLMPDIGLKVFIGLLGAYFLLKGFGIEERVFRVTEYVELSPARVSFVFYFVSILFIVVGLLLAVYEISNHQRAGVTNLAKLSVWFIKDLYMLPVALLLMIVGKVVEALHDKKDYLVPSHVVTASAIVLVWLIFNSAAEWVIGPPTYNTTFSYFFYLSILAVIAMTLVIYLAREFRTDLIAKMRLEGKDVYTEIGGRLGKIVEVDKKKETLIIQTPSNHKFDLEVRHIANVGENVVVSY
ncbi:DUF373 family protein [Candidatus Micrarchaeota archaeon]|nr:DUF373 family protein [Candidatus Micrarchaeota archaeon]